MRVMTLRTREAIAAKKIAVGLASILAGCLCMASAGRTIQQEASIAVGVIIVAIVKSKII